MKLIWPCSSHRSVTIHFDREQFHFYFCVLYAARAVEHLPAASLLVHCMSESERSRTEKKDFKRLLSGLWDISFDIQEKNRVGTFRAFPAVPEVNTETPGGASNVRRVEVKVSAAHPGGCRFEPK